MKTTFFQILRCLSGKCDRKETLQVQEQIENNLDFARRKRLLTLLGRVEKKPLPKIDMDVQWAKMTERMKEVEARSTSKVRAPKWKLRPFALPDPLTVRVALRYAFVLVLIAGGAAFFWRDRVFFNSTQVVEQMDYQTVKVEHGQRLNIELSDGTTIIADAGSEIRYPTSFSNRRDIYFRGEAYFKVAHDSVSPFYVHVNHALVSVLGTKFDVRAWDENPTVAVFVSEGKVSLSQARGEQQKSVILMKNEMSLLAPDSEPTEPQPINAQDRLGWMKNEIKFDNASVEEVLAQLQRWYDYEFVIQDSSILKDRLAVHILQTNVDDVLQVISLLTNTKIKKESNRIRLVPKKQLRRR